MKDLSAVVGREFKSKVTGLSYGVFRKRSVALPAGFSVANCGAPVLEDGCGNVLTEKPDGRICFWDHETESLTVVARSWGEFASACVEPEEVNLNPEQIKSVWIDPEFARKMGIAAPKNGWLKKKA